MTVRTEDQLLRSECAPGETTDAQRIGTFLSILFPSGCETEQTVRDNEPECFIDLNLDQVIDAVVARRDEAVLRPLFYSPLRDEEVVRHRQAVFLDLESPEVFEVFPAFCDAMRLVRANLDYAGRISSEPHKHTVILRAAGRYCDCLTALVRDLQTLPLRSSGLRAFLGYLGDYTASPAFMRLAKDSAEVRKALSRIIYGTLFRRNRVTVRKYASEPDYTRTILERFARFKRSDAEPSAPSALRDEFSLNHIEEAILEFVGRLYPEEFRRLSAYVSEHAVFIDEVAARFDREIDFFLSYRAFIGPIRNTGLPFCYPDVSASAKETCVTGSFDLALAAKLVKDKGTVVGNSFHLTGPERLIVVSGPNQGGKTTFARMFGQLHFLAGLGCPVPGTAARLFLPDRIFTHFERSETITNLRGKLEDELVRLHQTCEAMTPDSIVVLNEIFNSTSLDDQVFLSTQILGRILAMDTMGVCVTFIDALSTLGEKTVSMVSTVDSDNPAQRTFEIVRKSADGLAYALSLAEKRGVTYDLLRARIRP